MIHGTLEAYWSEVAAGQPCGRCAIAYVNAELARREAARSPLAYRGGWRRARGGIMQPLVRAS